MNSENEVLTHPPYPLIHLVKKLVLIATSQLICNSIFIARMWLTLPWFCLYTNTVKWVHTVMHTSSRKYYYNKRVLTRSSWALWKCWWCHRWSSWNRYILAYSFETCHAKGIMTVWKQGGKIHVTTKCIYYFWWMRHHIRCHSSSHVGNALQQISSFSAHFRNIPSSLCMSVQYFLGCLTY